MYLILCWSYLNHSLCFVGKKRGQKKKSHIESQSQYFGKKSQLDYFPKSFSPNLFTGHNSLIIILFPNGAIQLLLKTILAIILKPLVNMNINTFNTFRHTSILNYLSPSI